MPLATTQHIRACNARDPLTNWGGPAIFLVLSRCVNSRGCSDDRKIIDHLRFVDRALPISNCECRNRPRGTRVHAISCRQRVAEILVDPPALGASRAFFAIPPGPRGLDTCAARMHGGRTSVCEKSRPERTVSTAARALNDPPTNQKATPPGFLENPVVRGQDPGADQEGGSQDAGSAAVVAPAGSTPPLPQPNPAAPAPLADNLASAPPDFALDPVANPGGANPPASPGGALASAAGRPPANPAGPQVSGLSSIAQSPPARGHAGRGTGVQLP